MEGLRKLMYCISSAAEKGGTEYETRQYGYTGQQYFSMATQGNIVLQYGYAGLQYGYVGETGLPHTRSTFV